MKLSKKNITTAIIFSILGILIGSFSWEILERIISIITGNTQFSLSIKNPIQLFDFYVLSVYFRANPGSLLGFLGSLIILVKL